MNTNIAQKGFTLIELVVVMVILGILAAVAVPAYVDLRTQARIASLNSLAGSINGAAQDLIRGKYYALGNSPGTVYLQGSSNPVNIVSTIPGALNEGFPSALMTGLAAALSGNIVTSTAVDNSSFYFTTPAGTATGLQIFNIATPNFSTNSTFTAAATGCGVVYNAGTAATNAGNPSTSINPGQAVVFGVNC